MSEQDVKKFLEDELKSADTAIRSEVSKSELITFFIYVLQDMREAENKALESKSLPQYVPLHMVH
jgi:hypothetical protein